LTSVGRKRGNRGDGADGLLEQLTLSAEEYGRGRAHQKQERPSHTVPGAVLGSELRDFLIGRPRQDESTERFVHDVEVGPALDEASAIRLRTVSLDFSFTSRSVATCPSTTRSSLEQLSQNACSSSPIARHLDEELFEIERRADIRLPGEGQDLIPLALDEGIAALVLEKRRSRARISSRSRRHSSSLTLAGRQVELRLAFDSSLTGRTRARGRRQQLAADLRALHRCAGAASASRYPSLAALENRTSGVDGRENRDRPAFLATRRSTNESLYSLKTASRHVVIEPKDEDVQLILACSESVNLLVEPPALSVALGAGFSKSTRWYGTAGRTGRRSDLAEHEQRGRGGGRADRAPDQSGSITSTTKIRRMMNLMTNTAAAATSTAPAKSSAIRPPIRGTSAAEERHDG
jgi:hypothetical protein